MRHSTDDMKTKALIDLPPKRGLPDDLADAMIAAVLPRTPEQQRPRLRPIAITTYKPLGAEGALTFTAYEITFALDDDTGPYLSVVSLLNASHYVVVRAGFPKDQPARAKLLRKVGALVSVTRYELCARRWSIVTDDYRDQRERKPEDEQSVTHLRPSLPKRLDYYPEPPASVPPSFAKGLEAIAVAKLKPNSKRGTKAKHIEVTWTQEGQPIAAYVTFADWQGWLELAGDKWGGVIWNTEDRLEAEKRTTRLARLTLVAAYDMKGNRIERPKLRDLPYRERPTPPPAPEHLPSLGKYVSPMWAIWAAEDEAKLAEAERNAQ